MHVPDAGALPYFDDFRRYVGLVNFGKHFLQLVQFPISHRLYAPVVELHLKAVEPEAAGLHVGAVVPEAVGLKAATPEPALLRRPLQNQRRPCHVSGQRLFYGSAPTSASAEDDSSLWQILCDENCVRNNPYRK